MAKPVNPHRDEAGAAPAASPAPPDPFDFQYAVNFEAALAEYEALDGHGRRAA